MKRRRPRCRSRPRGAPGRPARHTTLNKLLRQHVQRQRMGSPATVHERIDAGPLLTVCTQNGANVLSALLHVHCPSSDPSKQFVVLFLMYTILLISIYQVEYLPLHTPLIRICDTSHQNEHIILLYLDDSKNNEFLTIW